MRRKRTECAGCLQTIYVPNDKMDGLHHCALCACYSHGMLTAEEAEAEIAEQRNLSRRGARQAISDFLHFNASLIHYPSGYQQGEARR